MLIILLHVLSFIYRVVFKPWLNSIPFYNLCGETRMINAIIGNVYWPMLYLDQTNSKETFTIFYKQALLFHFNVP